MVHLADFVDVIVKAGDRSFRLGQYRLHLGAGPGEIVAVIVHRVVRVLGRIKPAAFAVA